MGGARERFGEMTNFSGRLVAEFAWGHAELEFRCKDALAGPLALNGRLCFLDSMSAAVALVLRGRRGNWRTS